MTLLVIPFLIKISVIRRSQDETIPGLEAVLGAKASMTQAQFDYVYSFTIQGFYAGKKVIISVIYGDPFRIRHSEGPMEARVSVELTGEQIEKYGTGRGNMGLSDAFKTAFLGRAASRIHCGCLEMWCCFLLWPPTLKQLKGLIEQAVNRVEKNLTFRIPDTMQVDQAGPDPIRDLTAK